MEGVLYSDVRMCHVPRLITMSDDIPKVIARFSDFVGGGP
jgi:hypothetical protein